MDEAVSRYISFLDREFCDSLLGKIRTKYSINKRRYTVQTYLFVKSYYFCSCVTLCLVTIEACARTWECVEDLTHLHDKSARAFFCIPTGSSRFNEPAVLTHYFWCLIMLFFVSMLLAMSVNLRKCTTVWDPLQPTDADSLGNLSALFYNNKITELEQRKFSLF